MNAIAEGRIDARFNTNLLAIDKNEVTLANEKDGISIKIENDLVYIFAGGELPIQFLEKAGVKITKKFGEAILKH